MSKSYISLDLRRTISELAGNSCEYCLLPEAALPSVFHIDHIISEKQGGLTELDNLALACARCNIIKGSDISAYLPEQQIIVDLYNCRKDDWADHFELKDSGHLFPLSDTGKGTIRLIQLNHPTRVEIRRMLISVGMRLIP